MIVFFSSNFNGPWFIGPLIFLSGNLLLLDGGSFLYSISAAALESLARVGYTGWMF